MSTGGEEWRENSYSKEDTGVDRDGNKFYDREGEERPYRLSYNHEGGGRLYRLRSSSNDEDGERPQRSHGERSCDCPQRPSHSCEGGDRPYHPRFNSNNEGGERPQRPYNREGGKQRLYGRSQRPSYNREDGGRPYRPRFNPGGEGGDRPQHSYNRKDGEQRSHSDRPYRPCLDSDEGGDYPQRLYNHKGDNRPYRPRSNSGEGDGYRNNNSGGYRPRFNNDCSQGGCRPRPRTSNYDSNVKCSTKKQIGHKEQFADPNEPIRLNKFLANAGVCSRRETDESIITGVASVNGEVVTELDTKIRRSDVAKFHDEPVSIERKTHILSNKSKDMATISDNPQERRMVMDLVKGACNKCTYPVGRLDRNTTGVLLLTNDGDPVFKLTHPKFLKKKICHVHLDKNLTKADMGQTAADVQLKNGEIYVGAISYTDDLKKDQVSIEIHSGKNRIVRRIFESLGCRVVRLDRISFAGLTEEGLRHGDWRYLSEAEVNYLRMGLFE